MKFKDQKKEKSWWSNLSLELITKSSLNFLRDLHGLPRVRYVERSSVQKKLPIELWLTHPRLRVEKFPPGSLDVVNFIRNKNEKNETFTLEELYEAIYPSLPSREAMENVTKMLKMMLKKGLLTDDPVSSELSTDMDTDSAENQNGNFDSQENILKKKKSKTLKSVKSSKSENSNLPALARFICENLEISEFENDKVKSVDKIYSKVLENDFDVSYDEFVQYLSNLQERGFLEIGKTGNKKSASKLKVDLVYSNQSVEKAKTKRSKSKQKLNEIEVTNEVKIDPDPELENLMNRVMPLLNDSKRRYTSSKSKLRSTKANVKRVIENAKRESKHQPSARLSAALNVLENEDWKSTKNFDNLKKKLENILRWKHLGANQNLESTTCSSESREYESESSGMDSKQSEPLDLSVSKESVQQNDKLEYSTKINSLENVSNELTLNDEPIKIDHAINQSDSTSKTRSTIYMEVDSALNLSLKSPSPVSTPTRKMISKRNLSNSESSTNEKISEATILKRRRLSNEIKDERDFSFEAEKSSLELVKKLSSVRNDDEIKNLIDFYEKTSDSDLEYSDSENIKTKGSTSSSFSSSNSCLDSNVVKNSTVKEKDPEVISLFSDTGSGIRSTTGSNTYSTEIDRTSCNSVTSRQSVVADESMNPYSDNTTSRFVVAGESQSKTVEQSDTVISTEHIVGKSSSAEKYVANKALTGKSSFKNTEFNVAEEFRLNTHVEKSETVISTERHVGKSTSAEKYIADKVTADKALAKGTIINQTEESLVGKSSFKNTEVEAGCNDNKTGRFVADGESRSNTLEKSETVTSNERIVEKSNSAEKYVAGNVRAGKTLAKDYH